MTNLRFPATITKTFSFSAAHSLCDVVTEKHPCFQLHGHNYKAKIYLHNLIKPGDFVIDFKELSEIIEPLFFKYLDHQNLNITLQDLMYELRARILTDSKNLFSVYLPLLEKRMPSTCEALAFYIGLWCKFVLYIKKTNVVLIKCEVSETDKTSAFVEFPLPVFYYKNDDGTLTTKESEE